MGGSAKKPVSGENLFIVLAGVMNLQVPDIIRSPDSEETAGSPRSEKQYIKFDEF